MIIISAVLAIHWTGAAWSYAENETQTKFFLLYIDHYFPNPVVPRDTIR